MQLGRMYRWGNRYDEATKAYQQAIAFLKAHSSDPYMAQQVASAESEMHQMLAQRR